MNEKEVTSLRKANEAQSKRRRAKRTRVYSSCDYSLVLPLHFERLNSTSDNLYGKILGPRRRVNTVASSTDSITQLDLLVGELRDRLDLDKSRIQHLGYPGLEELRLEQGLSIVLIEQLQHGRKKVLHSVVMLELGGTVARPKLVPNFLGVGSAGADKPLRVVVEGSLRDLVTCCVK